MLGRCRNFDSSRRGNLVVLSLPTMKFRAVATWRGSGEGYVGDIAWQPVSAGRPGSGS